MRIGRSSSDNRTRVAVVTADSEFERSARETFGASSAIELAVTAGQLAEHCETLDVADATVVVVDLDASAAGRDGRARQADEPHRRAAAGRRGDPDIRRRRRAHAAADAGRRFPGQAGAAGRSGARLRARRQGPDRSQRSRPRRRSTRSCRRSAAPASPRWRSRRAMLLLNSGARAASRPPAWSISISSTAPVADYLDLEPRLDLDGDRAAAGPARPAAAGSDAVAPRLRPGGGRGAQPAGRDAHASIPTW